MEVSWYLRKPLLVALWFLRKSFMVGIWFLKKNCRKNEIKTVTGEAFVSKQYKANSGNEPRQKP